MTEDQLLEYLKIIQRNQEEAELNFIRAQNMIEKAYNESIATSNKIKKLTEYIKTFHTTLKFNQKK